MPVPVRVLIVDDSRIFRAALEEALADEAGVAVAGSVFSGEKALEFLHQTPTDVVTLDVEMPGMDGLQTLEAIRRFNAGRKPGTEVGVIMVSAFTKRGADVTVRALQAGAFDFVTKPSGPSAEDNRRTLRQQLAVKVQLFMAYRRSRSVTPAKEPPAAEAAPDQPTRRRSWAQAPGRRPLRAVVIAASTGGPRALEALLPALCARTEAPILIVQHMPRHFTQSLAESLARHAGRDVIEARDGDAVQPRKVYLAPGGKHLLLRSEGGRVLTGLNEQPPENNCRPSADVLFRSAAAVLGGDVVAVVLTGMGCDGTAGLGPLKRAGAYAIAQDEATSVVWGMPGSAAAAGMTDEVLPLGLIAAAVQDLAAGRGAR
jgi:two-component system chemotaxis response regulator CheB